MREIILVETQEGNPKERIIIYYLYPTEEFLDQVLFLNKRTILRRRKV